jgi:predicted metal-dependent HD superfamily phosphohydrolase
MDAPTPLARLEQRFRTVCLQCIGRDADPSGVDAAWETLFRGYTEPHRHYHDLSHLDHCLHGLDLATTVAKDPRSLELAIWFHDVVNEPGARDNEQRSAEILERFLGPHLPPETLRHIRRLIMTTTHRERPEGGDERFIADIDLSSLAKPWPGFLADGENLRAEEPERSDEDYYKAKVRFYRSLLKRTRLFNTVPFQLRYEGQGRENLGRSLALLAERGYA